MVDVKQIGFLHPGEMGISLAATAQNSGHNAYWVGENRSKETRARAIKNNLVEVQTIRELCEKCSVMISVCPPHAATDVARLVLAENFVGLYADANAISPSRAQHIGELMLKAGVEFVDGGIIGGPAWKPRRTWLYLSGRSADKIAACFASGPLETEVIGDEIGKASAVKMCFAAKTKGETALLCAIIAAAEQLGVRKELENQWSRYDSESVQNNLSRVSRASLKAWRFSGEMEEIASTFESAGLPSNFHLAASDIYQRITKFKGVDALPPVEDVIAALLNPKGK